MIQTLYYNIGPCRAPCHTLSVGVAALLRRVIGRWALYYSPGCTVSRHKVAPLSATIQLLYRDLAPSRAHCAVSRPLSAISWPYHNRGIAHVSAISQASSAVSWTSHGLSMRAPALPPFLASHNKICCIVT